MFLFGSASAKLMRRFHVWCEYCGYRAMFKRAIEARTALLGHELSEKHKTFAYEIRRPRAKLLKSL